MRFQYPLDSAASLVERIDEPPSGVIVRKWVLRDDNQQHYHGIVRLDDDPLYIELHWKTDGRAREQLVGLFRLHLGRLLSSGYVRLEHEDRPDDEEVRLRFYRGERGAVYIQVRNDDPALPVGVVDATVG
jgi:hypothetical protein